MLVPFGKRLSTLVRLPPRQVRQVLPRPDPHVIDEVQGARIVLIRLHLPRRWILIPPTGEISTLEMLFDSFDQALRMLSDSL